MLVISLRRLKAAAVVIMHAIIWDAAVESSKIEVGIIPEQHRTARTVAEMNVAPVNVDGD